MVIQVCIGSACHVYGAYEVVERLKTLVEENKANIEIELKSSFCMGNCGNGVNVMVDDASPISLMKEDVDTFFSNLLR